MAYDRYEDRGRDGRRSYRGNYDQGGDERGFAERATDEVRSWFGDDEAERRRDRDTRYDPRSAYRGGEERPWRAQDDDRRYRGRDQYEPRPRPRDDRPRDDRPRDDRFRDDEYRHNPGLAWGGAPAYREERFDRDHIDHGYRNWRTRQLEALDREYEEYRREHQQHFDNHFATWRSGREERRQLLGRIREHAEVVGSDGAHVGTVDKLRGEEIVLTKNDPDAGGRHHAVPGAWVQSVDGDRVTLGRTAAEARREWREVEGHTDGREAGSDANGPHILNRSFPGTY